MPMRAAHLAQKNSWGRHGVRLLPHRHALSVGTPCFLASIGPILCKSSGSTYSAGCPLVSVRSPTFAVSRTRPRVEGETFRRNPGLMRWSRLESLQPGGYLLEGVLGESFLDEGEHMSLFQANVRL